MYICKWLQMMKKGEDVFNFIIFYAKRLLLHELFNCLPFIFFLVLFKTLGNCFTMVFSIEKEYIR
jgi:hypothetical protein